MLRKAPWQKILLYALLSWCSVLVLIPMVWLIAAVLKGPDDLFHYLFFAPLQRFSLYNCRQLFTQIPYLRFMINSFFVAGCTVMVQLFFSSLGGFALAKYSFRGKKPIMVLMLGTMMIPAQVLLAPMYELIYRMGLVDSYLGLIVPGAVNVFGMFLFRQSMLDLPDDLLQAGRIDGCTELRLYWNIVLPVSRPMIGAFCLIAFMGSWNNFLWPQIVLHTQGRFTLPIGLNQMVGLYAQDYGAMMAGTFLAVLPVVILFFLLQKEFISGLTAGAVKG
ncbi:MAG: carbohydrate ABC transporter permease [Gemmatimonadetes bacterium]|mgnify:FL=1|jgi:ABC-type glycerol-3-phosphate transport system permease component|nr:carbohydrate ABC transporter permease [Gemmatimonadota bacterium]